jgi:hypothetical protein
MNKWVVSMNRRHEEKEKPHNIGMNILRERITV